jgi:hypothetical protein
MYSNSKKYQFLVFSTHSFVILSTRKFLAVSGAVEMVLP